ncbi:hypothetical protein [Dactylosporangium sp. CS-033363]|uniref:hypothetical protein n=1 Tax=Dactylosporangium sp. CS-033363 TaxID=3239935 RepID=UPI003D901F3E
MRLVRTTEFTPWNRPYYFSAADGGIEHNIADSTATFNNSLVYSILFQQGGIVLPDTFFFNNEAVLRHVTQRHSKWSFLQHAMRNGLVVPSFRSETTETFAEGLEAIGAQNILGLERAQYERAGTTPQKMAEALDDALVGSAHARRAYWERDMGAAYSTYLDDLFALGELPHPVTERQAELWTATAGFRHRILAAAKAATEAADSSGRPGVRRGEVWNVMGRLLDVHGAADKFDKPRQLLQAMRDRRDRDTMEQVQYLVDLVNVAYHNSQADAFNASRHSVAALTPIAIAIDADAEREFLMPSTLELELLVPSVCSILEAPPDRVLGVYRSGLAEEYFVKRRRWIENRLPERDTGRAEAIQAAAREYARELCRAAPGVPISLTFLLGGTSAAGLIKEVGNSYLGYLGNVQPSLAAYALVFGVGGAAVSYLVTRPRLPRQERVVLQRPPTRYPELGS